MKFLRQVGYNVLFFAAFFIAWPYFTYRLWKRGNLSEGFWQRLGFYPPDVRDKIGAGCDLWIHAVSVGETMIASVLIRHLRDLDPKLRIVLSTTTATGYKVAKRSEDKLTTVILNPTDFLWGVRQAFELIRPKRLILVESEIWPNYIWCAKRRKIPVYLVNARLSPRSERRYRRFQFFCRPVLQEIDLVMAQDEFDVTRLTNAGFSSEAIFPVGSLKYDVAAMPELSAKEIDAWWKNCGWSEDNLILLGGSTHSGEEEIMAGIYEQLREQWPKLKMVIAPRHAERGPQVKGICEQHGLRTILRTELTEPQTNGHTPEVLVLNSTGELKSLYPKATLVFIGKSLKAKGGQNFIEAARVGTPILVGPNMQNFQNLAHEFIKRRAIIQVADEFELSQQIRDLLLSAERRQTLGQKGKETFQANLGAGKRTAEIIYSSLANPR
jgi:3-deoxy-D-manno-octulosonic-acid transferase